MKAHHVLFALAALPVTALALLALAGGDEQVGIITGNAAPSYAVALGAAWVAAWLVTIALAPGLAVAAAISYAWSALARRRGDDAGPSGRRQVTM